MSRTQDGVLVERNVFKNFLFRQKVSDLWVLTLLEALRLSNLDRARLRSSIQGKKLQIEMKDDKLVISSRNASWITLNQPRNVFPEEILQISLISVHTNTKFSKDLYLKLLFFPWRFMLKWSLARPLGTVLSFFHALFLQTWSFFVPGFFQLD